MHRDPVAPDLSVGQGSGQGGQGEQEDAHSGGWTGWDDWQNHGQLGTFIGLHMYRLVQIVSDEKYYRGRSTIFILSRANKCGQLVVRFLSINY